MSREHAWSLAIAIDHLQRVGITPVVNPTRGGPPPVPTPPTASRALLWAVLTIGVLVAIVVTQVLLSGESAPFIYSEF